MRTFPVNLAPFEQLSFLLSKKLENSSCIRVSIERIFHGNHRYVEWDEM